MVKLKSIIGILLSLLLFTGCNDDDAVAPEMFEIAEDALTQHFMQGDTVVNVYVKTNLGAADWSVSCDSAWCKVSKVASSLTIALDENTETGTRSTTIKVTSSMQNYDIKVTQLGWGKTILLDKHVYSVNSAGKDITLRVTSNIDWKTKLPEDCDWIEMLPESKGAVLASVTLRVKGNPNYIERKATVYFVGAEDASISDSCEIIQKERSADMGEVEITGDILLKATGGKASEAQPGYGIENSYDQVKGNGRPYHSIWQQSAGFPVTLEYFFNTPQDMDYLIYYPNNGANGHFGELEIWVATQTVSTYKKIGDYNFRKKNIPTKVLFQNGQKKVTKVKFVVKSGANDFVCCDEMEFYRKGAESDLETRLKTVFTDLTCSELKPDVTTEQINTLPGYFVKIASMLQNNLYSEFEKDFRIRDYKAYSDVEEWAEKLMTKRYSNLDNCTGIYAEKGDSLMILVGDTHGHDISIQSIPEVASSGDVYMLNEGVNRICMRNPGMLFLMYTADPSNEPIRVHIPDGSGTVNGFFDLEEHKTDEKYAELLRKASYKYFLVRGEKIIFYFHHSRLMQFVPNNILSAINLWDNIIGWEQELMGIEDVRPNQVNNHVFAISPETGYMWASDYQIGFVDSYLNNVLLYDQVMSAEDNAWGPAHEIGHVHQAAINWPSSTESSNNLLSNYVLHKLGKYKSRGSVMTDLATARCIDKDPWFLMGAADHQNEDTEIHMRMNWQLWNYYHRCGYKPDFWQKLFKALREDRLVEKDPGASQLKFAVKASQVANENLTDFFEMWGMFVPVQKVNYEQYGTWQYEVTQEMIDAAKAEMAKLPAPKHAFYYLEDRKESDSGLKDNYKGKLGDVGYYTQFQNDVKITKNITYTRSGRQISIQNGDEAVAFEIRKGSSTGELLYFSNYLSFELPASVTTEGIVVCAVQADGTRIALKK